jgi:hypothetical protein
MPLRSGREATATPPRMQAFAETERQDGCDEPRWNSRRQNTRTAEIWSGVGSGAKPRLSAQSALPARGRRRTSTRCRTPRLAPLPGDADAFMPPPCSRSSRFCACSAPDAPFWAGPQRARKRQRGLLRPLKECPRSLRLLRPWPARRAPMRRLPFTRRLRIERNATPESRRCRRPPRRHLSRRRQPSRRSRLPGLRQPSRLHQRSPPRRRIQVRRRCRAWRAFTQISRRPARHAVGTAASVPSILPPTDVHAERRATGLARAESNRPATRIPGARRRPPPVRISSRART